jgi:MFS family permease
MPHLSLTQAPLTQPEDGVTVHAPTMVLNTSAFTKKQEKTPFPPEFWLACIASTLGFSASLILTTLLPLQWHEQGLNERAIAEILGAFLISSMMVRPLAGKLTNAFGAERLMLIGLSGFAIATLGFVYPSAEPSSLLALSLIRLLQGFGFSLFYVASRSYASLLVPEDRRTEGIGIHSTAEKIAMGIAPIIAWQCALQHHAVWGIWAAIGFSVLTLLSLLPTLLKPQPPRPSFSWQGSWWEPQANLLGLIMGSNSLIYGCLIPFVGLIALQRHYNLEWIQWFYAVYGFTLIVTRGLAGAWVDTYGRSKILIPGMLLVTLGLLCLMNAPSALVFLVGTAIYGLGAGVIQPAIIAWLTERTPAEKRGSAMATLSIYLDGGQLLGQYLMGTFGAMGQFGTGLLVAVCIHGLGTLLFAYSHRDEIKEHLLSIRAISNKPHS